MAVVLASVAFWAPGQLVLVGDDNKPFVVPFRARFKRLKTSERLALDRRLMAGRLSSAQRSAIKAQIDDQATAAHVRKDMQLQLDAEPVNDKQFLDMLMVDWDLKDLAKTAVLYTERVREELVEDWDGLEAAFVQAYFDAIRTAKETGQIAKNSDAPSDTTV